MTLLALWWKADCQTQSLEVVHLIQIFGHCARCAQEKYDKMHRVWKTQPLT